MARSPFRTRLALAIIRRYPRAWRERYEVEIAGYVEDSATSWRDVLDLARGCVVERARILFQPDRSPHLAMLLLWMARLLPALTFYGVLAGLASVLHARFPAPPQALGWAVLATLLPMIVVGGWAWVRARRGMLGGTIGPLPPRWAVAAWLALFSSQMVVLHWLDPPGNPPSRLWYADALHWFVWTAWIKGALDLYWPQGPRWSAQLMKIAGLREQLGRARRTLRRHESQRPDLGYSWLVEHDRTAVAKLESELATAVSELSRPVR